MLLDRYVELVEESCTAAFARSESQQRAIEHAIALPCTLGVRTIARTICTLDISASNIQKIAFSCRTDGA